MTHAERYEEGKIDDLQEAAKDALALAQELTKILRKDNPNAAAVAVMEKVGVVLPAAAVIYAEARRYRLGEG